jgi:hypothetical protein
MNRYAGKPFLRLLECYILDLIGQLPEKERASLVLMAPKLAGIYSTKGTWQEIVCKQMDLPAAVANQIKQFWVGYQAKAKSQGVQPDPNEFAMSFIDQNFPDVVG